MRNYIIVIDEGTTGVRACLFNKNMEMIGSNYEKLKLYYPEPGAVECDAEEILEKTIRTMRNVISEQQVAIDDIECIGLTTQRTSWVCWNKETGRPLRKAVVWLDGRGIHQKEKFINDAHFNSLFPGVAQQLPAEAPLLIMDRIKEQEPDFAENVGKETTLWGNIDAWLIWKLTKGHVFATVSSIASISMMYTIQTGSWNEPLINYMGFTVDRMPQILDEASDFGYLDEELLGAEIPIRSDIADQQSALFGQGCLEENSIKCTNGTGTFIDINIGKRLNVIPGLIPLAAWRLNGEMTYCLEGFSSTSGACLEWAKNQAELFNDFSEMDYLVSQVPNTSGVYFVPALSGLNGYPYYDATARAAYIGISPDVGKKHIVRATLEGLAYAVADIVEHIRKSGIPLSEIKVSGGVSKSDFICQTISDATGMVVVRPESVEATALGAARMAALQSGWIKLEALENVEDGDFVFKPKMDEKQVENAFEMWKEALKRTMNWRMDVR